MMFFRIPNLCLLIAVIGWIYLGLLPWREQFQIGMIESDNFDQEFKRLPFSVNSSRAYVNKKLLNTDADLVEIESLTTKNIKDRPLYAHLWLDMARIKYREGDIDSAIEYAEIAQKLWPTEGYLLYLVGSFWFQMGDFDKGIKTLGKYLSTDPSQVKAVFRIISHLETDSDRLLQLLFSNDSIGSNNRELLLKNILSYSISENRIGLSISLWTQFNLEMTIDSKLSMRYMNSLIINDYIDQAIKVWSQYTNNLPVRNVIVNEGFESQIINGGFGWRINSTAGVVWSVDSDISYKGQNSLKLDFNGQENLNFSNVQQIIPVDSGSKYRLTAYWRGKSITTRSTPFIQLSSIKGLKEIKNSTSKRGSWSWEKLSIEITMPEDSELLRVRIRRKKTSALDKNISGTIWFDDFKLEKL